MTGRSESAMDENDDEIEGISKCKAINSSYINLKRNNLLIAYGKRWNNKFKLINNSIWKNSYVYVYE